MAHPNRKEGIVGHNAKLKRMTQDYGAADPAMYKDAPGLAKGKQTDPSFGEGEASKPRGDKARRTSAANPIATYAKGGRVRSSGGGVIGGNVAMRAAGGRMEGEFGEPSNVGSSKSKGKKGNTNINIIVSPQAAPTPGPVMPPMMPPPGPDAGPPPGPPPGAGAGPGGPGGMPGGPGMIPPGAVPPGMPQLPRAKGGRVHPDVKEDKALVKQMVKPDALKRARGGSIKMTAGAESGPGRLEKSAARARRQAGDKSAEV